MRVLAVADADSYLKWSAATLDRLPADWQRRQVLLDSPIAPSPDQVVAATGTSITRLGLGALARLVRRDPPDVLLLACTGPTVAVLAGLRVARGRRRPVLVTGLPGISIPASVRAVAHRRDCDLLVVHSRRERQEFVALAATDAPGLTVALGGLPFLARDPAPRLDRAPEATEVVFAAQAKVPAAARRPGGDPAGPVRRPPAGLRRGQGARAGRRAADAPRGAPVRRPVGRA